MDGPALIEFDDEDDRYHRQTLISWWDQDRLASASAIVVGAGALGNELVKGLALTGVGRIVVVDLDLIENSNLARCVFFREADEGLPKAEVLAWRAMEMNPAVEVIPVTGDVRLALGLGEFIDADIVLGGLDNREARMHINQACWKTSTPLVDGAIEGLMGVARVFCPPHTACYECTMSERDHELAGVRRSCNPLTRDQMVAGKVPTTATTSTVIAGIQVQEAIKVLHEDRIGRTRLAGAGYSFVGLTHDSYLVNYAQREDCLAHDSYDLELCEQLPAGASIGDIRDIAVGRLGEEAVVDFEHELLVAARCAMCDTRVEFNRPALAVAAEEASCRDCGDEMTLEFARSAGAGSALLDLTPGDLGLPAGDIYAGRVGLERVFFRGAGGVGR